MGVLEEAIKEHLDLKRRHGASDEELTRQEAEALGPARRDVPEDAEGAEGEEAAEATAAVEPAVESAPVEPGLADAAPVEPGAVEPAPPVREEVPEPEPESLEPADQDTVMYRPGEAHVPPEEDADPDFGEDAPEQKPPPRDFDFD